MHALTGVAAALCSTLIWAFASTLFHPAIHRFGAFTCNLAKALVGMTLFWLSTLILFGTGDAGFGSLSGAGMLLISGVAGMALGDWAYFGAMRFIGVRQATLIHGTAPLFLLIWSLMHPEQSLSRAEIYGVLVVVLGVSIVSLGRRGKTSPEDAAAMTRGVICALLAAFGQAVGIELSHEALQEYHPVSGAAVRLTGAVGGLLLVQIFRRRIVATLQTLREKQLWRQMLFPSFLGTFIGIFFMMVAIERSPPAISSALLATTPIFVIPFAVRLLGEKVTPRIIVGTFVVVLGVALVSVGLGAS